MSSKKESKQQRKRKSKKRAIYSHNTEANLANGDNNIFGKTKQPINFF